MKLYFAAKCSIMVYTDASANDAELEADQERPNDESNADAPEKV